MAESRKERRARRADMQRKFHEPITEATVGEYAVEAVPREVMVALTTRFPRDLLERLFAEAQRRGTNPSETIRDLVAAALADAENDRPIPVRLGDLHRAIDAAVRKAAAA
jgi:hypothetical protein